MTPRSLASLLLLLITTNLVCAVSDPETTANSTEIDVTTLSPQITTDSDDISTQQNNEDQGTEAVTSTTETNHVEGNYSASLQAVVKSSNQFALNLYKVVSPEEGNILLSPLSIGVVLGILWLGSAEKTAIEIAEVLSLPQNRGDVTVGFHELFQSFKADKKSNLILKLANKLYAENSFMLNEDFHSVIRSSFSADAELLNFVADPDNARISINQWVEQQTQSHIKELLQKGTVSTDTKVIVVNAIYFKGLWKNPFMKESTHEMPFELADGSTVPVPTMLAIGTFPTAIIQHLNCTVIQMPYEESVSLLVLLPNSRQGLPDLEQNLSLQDLEDVIPLLEGIELHLTFPKFKLEFSTELEDAFKKLGIEDVFQTDANLSGISPIKGLSVTHVLHKSFLEITEEGSEASAVTGAVLDIRGGTLSITVDHPFMFVIREDKTGTILFLGHYNGPQ